MSPVHLLTRNCVRIAAALVLMSVICSSSDAAILVYSATLSGPAEDPPNNSPGTGFSLVTLDTTANTMRVQASFSGLTGNTSAAHIHGPTGSAGTGVAGVMTMTPSFAGFPLGVTAGTMDQTYDMSLASSYRAGFITANGGTPASAFAVLSSSLAAGTAYFNIHTSTFGGGEIRGFFTAVPEPSSLMLTGIAMVGLGAGCRRKRA